MPDNVIHIGDYRFTHKRDLLPQKDACEHINTTLDDNGELVLCNDCGAHLSAYWVLKRMLSEYSRGANRLRNATNDLNSLREKNISLLSARKVEKTWRNRTMIPSCPHCHAGIFPTDGFGGSMVNKEIERRRREVEKKQGGEE